MTKKRDMSNAGTVFLAAFFMLLFFKNASTAIHTVTVEYKDGSAVLEGYLAYDDSIRGKRPGILVIHEWTGVGDYVMHRVKQLAETGYVAFAADIYGKGIRPKNREEAARQSGIYRSDRALLRSRAKAGLDILRKHPLVETSSTAVIGYCFGGGAALELARSGADIKGAVSFHGNLDTPNPEDARNIKGKILVLHGADDPGITLDQVGTFQKEMRDAGVDWYMSTYGNAVHSFTNPASGDDPSKGAAYNREADMRSWREMISFFDEIFHGNKIPLKARAELMDSKRKPIGSVTFTENEHGLVRIEVDLSSFLAGKHALHIHESPLCEPPDFKSAGGHFNPNMTEHGFLNQKGPHAGDLPNIIVDDKGNCRMSFTTNQITLKPNLSNSLLRSPGTSVIIHEMPDDYFTDPAGGGGKRIACGTIRSMGEMK